MKNRYWLYGGVIGISITYILFIIGEYVYSYSFLGMFIPFVINRAAYFILYGLSYVLSFFIGGMIGSMYGQSKRGKKKR